MEPIDAIGIAGLAALIAGAYITVGVGVASLVAGIALLALWVLLSLFGADQ